MDAPEKDSSDSSTGMRIAAVGASAADAQIDPARYVSRSGLHAGKDPVELRLPAVSGDR